MAPLRRILESTTAADVSRIVIALGFLIIVGALLLTDRQVPDQLYDIALLVVGYYFGRLVQNQSAQ